jgi:hypothetical protein
VSALGQCGQFGPDDARVDLARRKKAGKAAIGAGNHIFVPDNSGKAADPMGDCLRILDQVRHIGDDPRDQQLAFRQFDRFPDTPFMLVPWIAGFERLGAGPYAEHDVDNVLQFHIVDARPY